MGENRLPDPGYEAMYRDLHLRAAASAARLRAVAETKESSGQDLMSTAPGVDLLLRAVTRDLRSAAGEGLHSADGYTDEEAWIVNLPLGAYKVMETSVMLTPRATFNEEGQLMDAEAWLSVPTESVIEIHGSNGTSWKNEL